MKTSNFLKANALLALAFYAPLAFGKDEGWVDVVAKTNAATSRNFTAEQVRDAESYANAFARFAANAKVRYNRVPAVELRYEANQYRFYFTDPTDGARKYVQWEALISGNWDPK